MLDARTSLCKGKITDDLHLDVKQKPDTNGSWDDGSIWENVLLIHSSFLLVEFRLLRFTPEIVVIIEKKFFFFFYFKDIEINNSAQTSNRQ